MQKALKTLPEGYTLSASVSIKNMEDLKAMLLWSLALLAVSLVLVMLVLFALPAANFTFSLSLGQGWAGDLLRILAATLLVTVGMVVLHEGLHGLVFWLITHERPRFTVSWYYASACAEGWYLPRAPFMVATLLPLIAITLAGLALLPVVHGFGRLLLVLLITFNASGAAGDVLVAQKLAGLPRDTFSLDSGAEVKFYSLEG